MSSITTDERSEEDVDSNVLLSGQFSTCSLCRKRGEWTRTVEPIDADDHYRFYPPKGWHSAGVSPGFCSQLCADGWALLESDAEKFRERRRKEILKDNAEFSHPRNED